MAKLPERTWLYGIPVELATVQRWRRGLPEYRWAQLPRSRRYYTDGSCLRPRYPDVRVAAWAVAGLGDDGWWTAAGPCPGRQTIGRAELAAVAHVLRGAPVGCIVTDCLGVFRKCEAIRDGWINREHLQKGTNADLWMLVWEALRADPSWTFEWVASHQSEGEAAASGIEPDK